MTSKTTDNIIEKKKSFLIYGPEFLAAVSFLTNSECGTLIKALCEYNSYGFHSKTLSEKIQTRFNIIQEIIDDNHLKYAEICKKRKANGFLGGRPSKTKNNQMVLKTPQNKNQTKPDNENEYDNEDDNDIFINNKNIEDDNGDKSDYVAGPSVEDVTSYCKDSGYAIDPIAFVRWNSERGWMNGKKCIALDWQKAVRKWYCKDNKLSFEQMEGLGDLCNDLLRNMSVSPAPPDHNNNE